MSLVRRLKVSLILSLAFLGFGCTQDYKVTETVSLFDGKSLANWQAQSNDVANWRVENGLITGGSLTTKATKTTFLVSEKSYQNFDLHFKIRVQGTGKLVNSGMQVRSKLEKGKFGHRMTGFQVDAGDGWWGKLYDEGRRKKVISTPVNLEEVLASINKNDWNEYRILCEGNRLRTWINGVPTLDYVELDPTIPLDGHLGLQLHGGGNVQVQLKEVTIKELPSNPNLPSWILKADNKVVNTLEHADDTALTGFEGQEFHLFPHQLNRLDGKPFAAG